MNNESPESGPGQLGPSQDRPPAAAPAAKSTAAARAAARRSSRRRKISVVPALILLAVVGLVVAAFSAKPVWRMIKRQRAERFLVEGEKYAAEEKWSLAFERGRSAVQLAPNHVSTVRYMARLYGRLGLEQGFSYFERLVTFPGATRQDREDYAALAIRVGNVEIANAQLEDLLELPDRPPRTLILGAQLAGMRRDFTNGVRLAREAYQKESGNPTNAFTLASFLISSREVADRNEGRAVLWPIARASGPVQIQALGAILEGTESPRADREEVEAILRAKTNRSISEELMHCSARVSLDPSALGKVADEVTEKFGRGTPEQTAAAAGWLNRHQLFAQARDLLLPEAALKDARLFNLRFAALMGLKDARGAYDFIKSDKAPGDPLQVEMLRCGTALQLKDQALIDAHFHALIELGKRNGRSLRMVAEYAIRVGQRPAAIEAYKLLQKNPRDAATAIQGLMRLTDRAGKTWEARDYARALAKLRKDDDSVKLQLAYYDVLLKENLEEASGILEKLHLSKPEDFNRRVTLALAHLRQNKPKEAFNLLEGQMVSWNRTVPGLRAIVAATFDANGRRSVASNLVSRMPLGLLKPEERELLRPIVGSAALSTNAPDATPVIENPVEK